jgi:hypothetical protein
MIFEGLCVTSVRPLFFSVVFLRVLSFSSVHPLCALRVLCGSLEISHESDFSPFILHSHRRISHSLYTTTFTKAVSLHILKVGCQEAYECTQFDRKYQP